MAKRSWNVQRAGLAAAVMCAIARLSAAHETDQFTVPHGMRMADIGPYLTLMTYDNIRHAVEKTNDRIERAKRTNPSSSEVERLKSGATIAAAVRSEFPNAMFIIDGLDADTRTERMYREHPGEITGYKDFSCIYEHSSFILDPRQFFKLFRAGTVRVGEVYLGADKVGHFLDKGYLCFERYNSAVRKSGNEEDGYKAILDFGTGGDLIFSERGMLGRMSSGAYSNADLCADLMGFTFFRNLSEPMMVQGRMREPMLMREGDLWVMAEYVQPDSLFFTELFSHHMDEALNPVNYEPGMRGAIRNAVQERAEKVLDWYRDENGQRRSARYFREMRKGLESLWGRSYGHMGSEEEIIAIDNTCFEKPGADAPAAERLMWAAGANDMGLLEEMIRGGADVNAQAERPRRMAAERGDTALHVAARCGNLEAVRALVRAGAKANIGNGRGETALHAGTREGAIVAELLGAGAEVNAVDEQGRGALAWAGRYDNAEGVLALLGKGADARTRDNMGRTALHDAAEAGAAEAVDALCKGGAEVNATTAAGMTALHLGARQRDSRVTQVLIGAGADASAGDIFGWTALHAAGKAGMTENVKVIAQATGNVNAKDAEGATAAHLAARFGHPEALRALIQHGADVQAVTDGQSSVLHEAAFSGRPGVVRLLLEAGADAEALNGMNQGALQVARQRKATDAAALIHAWPSGGAQ